MSYAGVWLLKTNSEGTVFPLQVRFKFGGIISELTESSMEAAREWGRTVTSYLSMTYSGLAFVLAMEAAVVGLWFADSEVFGELAALLLDAHTLFLVPVVVFTLIRSISGSFFASLDPVAAIVFIIAGACVEKSVWMGILVIVLGVWTIYVQQEAAIPQLVLGMALALLEFILYRSSRKICIVVALVTCIIATLCGFICGKQLHTYIANLAFVVFDTLFRLLGQTSMGFYATIACAFITQYIAMMLKDRENCSSKKTQ